MENIIKLYILTIVICEDGNITDMETFQSPILKDMMEKGNRYMENYCEERQIPLIDKTDDDNFYMERYEKVRLGKTAISSDSSSQMQVRLEEVNINLSVSINIDNFLTDKESDDIPYNNAMEVRENVVNLICKAFLYGNEITRVFYPITQSSAYKATNAVGTDKYGFKHVEVGKEERYFIKFNKNEMEAAIKKMREHGYYLQNQLKHGFWQGYCSTNTNTTKVQTMKAATYSYPTT